jgi:transcriptional regulator with XRE-family HTH domain
MSRGPAMNEQLAAHMSAQERPIVLMATWMSGLLLPPLLRKITGRSWILASMTTQTKKATAVLVGSVALASAAYALGSQAGDGGAVANGSAASSSAGSSTTPVHDGRRGARNGFGLPLLADRLGVSVTALRDALSEIRRDAPSREQRRARFAAALASALNLPADKVTAALDKALPDRAGRRDAFTDALAKELGVDAAKVRAALQKLHDDRRGDRGAGLAALAREIGVTEDKLRAALVKLHDDRRGRHDRGGHRGDRLEALASALGVSEDKLDAALDRVSSDARDAFATQLAQQLNITADKVKDVLADLPRRGWRHG